MWAGATRCKGPVFNHDVTAFTRKNSCHAFCWRPRLHLQLHRSRKPHPSSDLEWRHWAGSTHVFFSLSTVNMIVFDRKLKPKLGPLATSPLERGSPRGI